MTVVHERNPRSKTMNRTFITERQCDEFDGPTQDDLLEFAGWCEAQENTFDAANNELLAAPRGSILNRVEIEAGSIPPPKHLKAGFGFNVRVDTVKSPTLHPSHQFVDTGGGDGIDFNCHICDCKPWHQAARQECFLPEIPHRN